MPGSQINSVVVCEDIRTEANGKSLFIGVYAGDIVVHNSPATLIFSLWFMGSTAQHENKFEINISLTTLHDDKQEVLFNKVLESNVADDIPIDDTKDFNIALIGLPVHVEKDSTFTVKARKIGGKWKVLTKKNITLSVSSSAIKQPS